MREHSLTAIAERLHTVEPALPLATIRAAIDGVLGTQPSALRILAILDTAPQSLLSAQATMPRALERIIHGLLDAGALTVRAPKCSRCGHANDLVSRLDGHRVCASYFVKGRREVVACSNCGALRQRPSLIADRHYCRTCLGRARPGAAGRPLTRLVVLS